MKHEKTDVPSYQRIPSVTGNALILNVSLLSGLLPVILVMSNALLFTWESQQPSISDYVYTSARPFFYGIVFTLGLVLLFYKGYPENDGPIPMSDNQLATLSGIGALIVAIVPSNHCFEVMGVLQNDFRHIFWGQVHTIGAGIAYTPMALFLLFYFTQSGGVPENELPRDKIIRNRIYRICGWLIVISITFVIGMNLWKAMSDAPDCATANEFGYVFWAECVMQFAVFFGWGTKFAGRRFS